jgi:hypothetical protein
MHVSSRDSPQSLEFWEDGRQSRSNHIVEKPPSNEVPETGFQVTCPLILASEEEFTEMRLYRLLGNEIA